MRDSALNVRRGDAIAGCIVDVLRYKGMSKPAARKYLNNTPISEVMHSVDEFFRNVTPREPENRLERAIIEGAQYWTQEAFPNPEDVDDYLAYEGGRGIVTRNYSYALRWHYED